MDVAIYCRVSTAGQEAEGTSLDTQEAACRAYAAERGYAVAEVYREVFSGAELWARPCLSELREAVRRGEVEAIIAHAVDRLSREQAHLYILDHECERAGVELLFVTEEFDKTPVGKMIRSVKGFAAELEREKIRERTMRGKAARTQAGRLGATNRPLYGYRWEDAAKSRYVIVEEHAEVVRQMFNLAGRGYPLRSIARDLTKLGIPSPNGRERWVGSAIRGMLTHEGYKGVAIASRTMMIKDKGKTKQVPRPVEERIILPEGTIPPIVSPALWDDVQEQLRRNKAEAPRNNRDPESFLLRSGFVRCAECGNAAHATWESHGKDQARTPSYRIRRGTNAHHHCTSLTISARKLDRAVWRKVAALVTDPRVIASEVERQRGQDRSGDDLVAVDRVLEDVRRKQANLGRALSLIDDEESAAPLVTEMKGLGERRRQLLAEREEAAKRHAASQAMMTTLTTVQAWAAVVATNLEGLDYAGRRDLLTALNVEVTLHKGGHWEMTTDLEGVCIVNASS